jgi:hypothetical protein
VGDRSNAFDAQLSELGFRPQGESRRGGRMWVLPFNRYLSFVLHDYDDAIVLTWSFALGDYVLERDWRIGVSDTSMAELYPQADVRLPMDIAAVEGEIRRVLATLRLDLGAPGL